MTAPVSNQARKRGRTIRPIGRSRDAIVEAFKALYPEGTAAALRDFTGAGLRHCERILAGQRGVSGDTLHRLLWSPAGSLIFRKLMVGCEDPWWRRVERAEQIADLRRRQEEQRRLIERLEQEAGE